MTDHLTENARLRAALRSCAEAAKWTPKHPACEKIIAEVSAALATPAPDPVQEAGAEYAAGFAEGIRRAADAVPNGWQGQPYVSGMDYGPTTAAKAKSAILALTTDATPAPDAVQEAARDTDLLLDAYKGLLILHRLLDKIGLQAGVKTTSDLTDRIVAAHPEFPGRAALRAIAGGQP